MLIAFFQSAPAHNLPDDKVVLSGAEIEKLLSAGADAGAGELATLGGTDVEPALVVTAVVAILVNSWMLSNLYSVIAD